MFSSTTMASSTTNPVASVRPKSERVLIEKPRSFIAANVPISETGIVMDGMIVLCQLCKKMKMTRTTKRIAISNVTRTSLIDARTKSEVSKAILYS